MSVSDAITLLNTAGLGVIAYLLLTRVDGRLSALERAVNRFVLVTALDLIRRPETSQPVRRQARELVRDLRKEDPQLDGDLGDAISGDD